ncbi:nickel-dependent lactate racemase [Candidatus Poribacteria bacterium]|nr:nickel-dependent lactate racemase [Candidatus Poribacteria bacterium]MBT5711092.1 nickel-dependent lactate racemase [Candidatus Poribacteria bacterium]MBT7101779.1 nickel-dependent lactate racemase [Candidatus Poribacteria bacterium]MBT7803884.1 nickel-dependent lactate racemase [Candidatus Poribacteria bacterium]
MQVTMRYGRDGRVVQFPDPNTTVLRMRPSVPVADPVRAVADALVNPIGARPLHELARGRDSACVVISDITRPVPNRLILPPILQTLESAGIRRDDILILIATGIHRPNEGDELIELVGEAIASTYRVENHFSEDLESHRDLGKTSNGTRVLIDERYCAADLKVTTALIEPHLMAGYSGGRKAVCPGLASIETMKVMHGPGLLEHPSASTGILDGNPFHEEALEIARIAGVDFNLNVSLDENRALIGVFGGDINEAHRAGCAFVEERVRVDVEPAPIVVTTCAGHPLDQTFYQAIKGPVGALDAVQEGGSILLMSACNEGIGSPPFEKLMHDTTDLTEFVEGLYDPAKFVIDQWQLEELAKVTRKASVYCFTDGIEDDVLKRLFVTPVSSPEDGIRRLLDHHGADARILAIPEGPYVMPVAGSQGQASQPEPPGKAGA